MILVILLRGVNLDKKPYWEDETYTLARASGYGVTEISGKFYNGSIFTVEDLLEYQKVQPSTSAFDTIEQLAKEVPQHPPLYFLLVRFWSQIPFFDSSKMAFRSLSVLMSLLAFPAFWWLCSELFTNSKVKWVAVALFSVSPIYIKYAQTARPYSLWLLLIILSCAALLKASGQPTRLNWGIYSLTVALSLYCQLFSALVFLGHGIYILVIERVKLSQTFQKYLFSSGIGIIFFLPWILVFLRNQERAINTVSWTTISLPFSSLVKFWSLSLNRTFVAWHYQYDYLWILAVPVLLLSLYSFYFLWANKPIKNWLFIIILTIIIFLFLAIPDIFLGGQRSISQRYLLPSYLGIYLGTAYLLGSKISSQRQDIKTRFWQLITIVIIVTGTLSSALSVQAKTWWGWSEYEGEIAQKINQSPQRLLITDVPLGLILPLSHELK
ncbi:glycosyltransferase family 39 protein, partial [Hyella patelloides]|uniref:glycosyltransferase family 39 protein n=1 Tax=Hyella patelloides TaxID=1982969 RepID=UPI001643ADA9